MTDITKLMRPHLVKVATYHGVDPSEELARSAGIDPRDVIRLNANENPYGAPDSVLDALKNLEVNSSRVFSGSGIDKIAHVLLEEHRNAS